MQRRGGFETTGRQHRLVTGEEEASRGRGVGSDFWNLDSLGAMD